MGETNAVVRAAEDSFQIMDRLDDEIIEAELKNRVVNTWAYSFKGSDGRLQEGLSKVGVDEACVEMSKRGYIIREGIISMQKDPTNSEYILFQCPASLVRITNEAEEILMDTVNGTKRQWIKMKLKNGQIIDDPFWYEKGAMKAARNARVRLIPSETKTKILVLARQNKKVKDIEQEIPPQTHKTGPTSDAETKRRIDYISTCKEKNPEATYGLLKAFELLGDTGGLLANKVAKLSKVEMDKLEKELGKENKEEIS